MMFTRLVRIQLVIFTVASLVGISVMAVRYLQAPTLLGVGRIGVTLELPDAGGLYQFANVTYRGVQIGKVTGVDVNRHGAIAHLSLATAPEVPTDVIAEVRSVSAVGEQYVDLRPRQRSGPYLQDGSVIPRSDTVVPQQVGPMLDQLSALITSVPKGKLSTLLDESFQAFDGAGYDLQSLIDSTSRVAADAKGVADRTSILVDDAAPVLDSQAMSADSLRTWSRSLARVTRQLVDNDAQVRTLLDTGPGAADEASQLLDQVKPTLPVLLANLTSLGQVAVTYRPGLEQLLVILPPATAFYLSSTPANNPTGIPLGDFRISVADPPACTVGFLPPSAWRSPADTTTIDTPDGLYCKLPQDSPIGVRGVRNTPCMRVPGKFAPTIQECNSDKPFQPIAQRQHALGPYPLDPNLIAQGGPARLPRNQWRTHLWAGRGHTAATGSPSAPTRHRTERIQPRRRHRAAGRIRDLRPRDGPLRRPRRADPPAIRRRRTRTAAKLAAARTVRRCLMARTTRVFVTAMGVTAACTVGSTAHAAPDDFAVNGVFTVVSDGRWAKTNERVEPRPTVTATWTIASSCSTFEDCTGTVSSEQGWTADLLYRSGRWRVARTLPDWLPCDDGTVAPGEQSFIFWPRRRDVADRDDHLIGWDETVGPSGACGINRWVTIRMPLNLTRIA